MNAKLDVKFDQEMKTDVKKWLYADKELIKLFPKKLTHTEKVDLNPKKWNPGKLSNALAVLVRAELQLFAQRIGDIKKTAGETQSPKERNKTIAAIKQAVKSAESEISDKCSEALDDLASGKGEAKAGLAILKKVMSKVKGLEPAKVFSEPLDAAISSAKAIKDVDKKGGKVEAAQAVAKKGVVSAITSLSSTGKELQKASKYLQDNGKKLAKSDLGPLAAFGKKITDKKVLGPLQALDSDINKLEAELTTFAKDLKAGAIDAAQAESFRSNFDKLKGQLNSAGTALKTLKSLETDYKAVEKHLK